MRVCVGPGRGAGGGKAGGNRVRSRQGPSRCASGWGLGGRVGGQGQGKQGRITSDHTRPSRTRSVQQRLARRAHTPLLCSAGAHTAYKLSCRQHRYTSAVPRRTVEHAAALGAVRPRCALPVVKGRRVGRPVRVAGVVDERQGDLCLQCVYSVCKKCLCVRVCVSSGHPVRVVNVVDEGQAHLFWGCVHLLVCVLTCSSVKPNSARQAIA